MKIVGEGVKREVFMIREPHITHEVALFITQ